MRRGGANPRRARDQAGGESRRSDRAGRVVRAGAGGAARTLQSGPAGASAGSRRRRRIADGVVGRSRETAWRQAGGGVEGGQGARRVLRFAAGADFQKDRDRVSRRLWFIARDFLRSNQPGAGAGRGEDTVWPARSAGLSNRSGRGADFLRRGLPGDVAIAGGTRAPIFAVPRATETARRADFRTRDLRRPAAQHDGVEVRRLDRDGAGRAGRRCVERAQRAGQAALDFAELGLRSRGALQRGREFRSVRDQRAHRRAGRNHHKARRDIRQGGRRAGDCGHRRFVSSSCGDDPQCGHRQFRQDHNVPGRLAGRRGQHAGRS